MFSPTMFHVFEMVKAAFFAITTSDELSFDSCDSYNLTVSLETQAYSLILENQENVIILQLFKLHGGRYYVTKGVL